MAEKQFGPRCPNHHVVLDKTGDKGIGICPISEARFSYSEDSAEKTRKLRINAMGKMEETADWKVTHIEGEDI